MNEFKTLDPLNFPLGTNALIEASAGTGKTFTIAFLYVRLVLGESSYLQDKDAEHTQQNVFLAQGLLPRDILVVTFTEAATKELTDRIRANLVLAAEVFSDAPQIPAGENVSLLVALKNRFHRVEYSSCRKKLLNAVELMDEAAISTIHSWCNRMLSEHAFDSGSLFKIDVESNQQHLIKKAIQDYWRTNIYPLKGDTLVMVTNAISSPDALQTKIRDSISKVQYFDKPTDWLARFNQVDIIKQQIQAQDWSSALHDAHEYIAANGAKLKVNNKSVQATLVKALISVDKWISAQYDADTPEGFASWVGFSRLTTSGFAELTSDSPIQICSLFDQLAQLNLAAAKPELDLLMHASHCVFEQTHQEQLEKAEYGYDELLTQLHKALCSKKNDGSLKNVQLANTIAKQFPVALIDEFQDTDPIQFGIFQSIYLSRSNPASAKASAPSTAAAGTSNTSAINTSLIMIGDPKQAIYSFRGGDIYTYLNASEAVANNKYTLSTNYRSTHAMVASVNRLFLQAEQRTQNAFNFEFKGQYPMPFYPVEANGLDSSFVLDGHPSKSLMFWKAINLNPKGTPAAYNADAWRQNMAAACAQQIADILSSSDNANTYFLHETAQGEHAQENAKKVRVLPSDIAILVNKKSEADEVKKALLAKNLNSVYLSTRGSVLDTQHAKDVLVWLKAVAEPTRVGHIRNALGTPSINRSFVELHSVITNESLLDEMVQQFSALKQTWQHQGVLPMLRKFMLVFDVQQTLLHGVDGERSMTDLLHIGELLQQASLKIDGISNLISYFESLLGAEEKGEVEFNKPRLESDSDLIKIVTVHKSKGLQYPLVFLPYASSGADINNKQTFFSYNDEDGNISVSFQRDVAKEPLQKESEQEEIRKLYVGLTRAKYATWVGMANNSSIHKSGIAYLLGIRDSKTDFGVALNDFCQTMPEHLQVQELPANTGQMYKRQQVITLGAAREAKTQVQQTWDTFSYSSIKYLKPKDDEALKTSDSTNLDQKIATRLMDNQESREVADEDQRVATASTNDNSTVVLQQSLHTFHKGAQAGTFLHDILEWAAHQGFAHIAEHPQQLKEHLMVQTQNMGWSDYADVVCEWMMCLIADRIPIGVLPAESSAAQNTIEVSLAELSLAVPEMEFWFSTDSASLQEIDALVTSHIFPGMMRPSATPQIMTGIFKGFIDLTFEQGGRYYVLDYKSNYLGESDEFYTQENIEASILSHRYDLQFVIYIVALHRLLQQRLKDYDYDKHVGGCVYYFLRGIHAPTKGIFNTKPPLWLIEQIDDIFKAASDNASMSASQTQSSQPPQETMQ